MYHSQGLFKIRQLLFMCYSFCCSSNSLLNVIIYNTQHTFLSILSDIAKFPLILSEIFSLLSHSLEAKKGPISFTFRHTQPLLPLHGVNVCSMFLLEKHKFNYSSLNDGVGLFCHSPLKRALIRCWAFISMLITFHIEVVVNWWGGNYFVCFVLLLKISHHTVLQD